MNYQFNTLKISRNRIQDILYSTLPQLVSLFVGLFGSILMARGLGPKVMGQYALILSITGFAYSFSDLGIGQTAIRYASKAYSNNQIILQLSILRWAFRLRLLAMSIVIITLFFFTPILLSRIWHQEELGLLIRIGLIGGFFTIFTSIPIVYYQSIQNFKVNSIVSSLQKIVSFIGIAILAIFSLWTLKYVIYINILVTVMAAIAFVYIVPKESLFLYNEFKINNLKKIFSPPNSTINSVNNINDESPSKFLGSYLLITLISIVMGQTDIWMISHYLNQETLGIYSVAIRFTLPITIIFRALTTVLWPYSAGLTNIEGIKKLLNKVIPLSLIVTVIMIIYSFSAPYAAVFLFGESYEGSKAIAQILCLRYSIAILSGSFAIIGYNLGLSRLITIVNLIQLVVVVAINIWLLPKIGAIASAWALFYGEVVLLLFIASFDIYHIKKLTKH